MGKSEGTMMSHDGTYDRPTVIDALRGIPAADMVRIEKSGVPTICVEEPRKRFSAGVAKVLAEISRMSDDDFAIVQRMVKEGWGR